MILRTDNTPTLFDNLADCIPGMLDKRKGFILYNNGKITKRFHQDDIIPEGFVKGRFKKEINNEN